MILWKLWTAFFKIGLFNFGGGYAMIPLIQTEIVSRGWIDVSRFIDIIAIAQMTPGAIAVNSATYVGNTIGGVFGGIIATLGVAMPSYLCGQILGHYHEKYKKSEMVKMIFYGIRPIVAGFILAAGLVVAMTVSVDIDKLKIMDITGLDFKSLGITAVVGILLYKTKVHPMLLIVISGVLGALLFS